MKSIRYPQSESSRKVWPQFWRDVNDLILRCKVGLPKGYDLRHISIDVKDESVVVFFEETDAQGSASAYQTR